MGKISKWIPVLSRIVMVVGIIMVFMTTGFTSKASDGDVRQISQTMNSVTVSLQPELIKKVKTSRYGICEITKSVNSFDAADAAHAQAISKKGVPCKLSGTSFTFSNLKPGTSYWICFGYNDKDYLFTHNCLITTLPDKPTGVKVYASSDISHRIKVDYRSGVKEFRYKLYDIDDVLIDRGAVDNTINGFTFFNLKNFDFPSIGKLVLTPVADINERAVLGESTVTYIIDQPSIVRGSKRRSTMLKNGKLTFSWYKVEGATGYDIYISEDRFNGYEKAATVKGKNDTVTIKKCHKKKIKKNKTYYVSIRPKYKKDGVTYTAPNVLVWSITKKGSRSWLND